MNSNLFFLFLLIFISACGVKGDPVSPQTPKLPSLLENYPDVEVTKPLDEKKRR